jgi:hypothetical protein
MIGAAVHDDPKQTWREQVKPAHDIGPAILLCCTSQPPMLSFPSKGVASEATGFHQAYWRNCSRAAVRGARPTAW